MQPSEREPWKVNVRSMEHVTQMTQHGDWDAGFILHLCLCGMQPEVGIKTRQPLVGPASFIEVSLIEGRDDDKIT
jgi:hypothetical protein